MGIDETLELIELRRNARTPKARTCSDRSEVYDVFRCSVCGVDVPYGDKLDRFNYCPNCGSVVVFGD